MREIEVKLDGLIARLEENRARHRELFEEAWEAFKEKAIENFQTQIEILKDPKAAHLVSLHIGLEKPSDHTDDYDRTIEMLKLHVHDTIELDEDEFQNYWQDDWRWSTGFSSAYMSNTGKVYSRAKDEI